MFIYFFLSTTHIRKKKNVYNRIKRIIRIFLVATGGTFMQSKLLFVWNRKYITTKLP